MKYDSLMVRAQEGWLYFFWNYKSEKATREKAQEVSKIYPFISFDSLQSLNELDCESKTYVGRKYYMLCMKMNIHHLPKMIRLK